MALLEPEDNDWERRRQEIERKAKEVAAFSNFLDNPELSVEDILNADGET